MYSISEECGGPGLAAEAQAVRWQKEYRPFNASIMRGYLLTNARSIFVWTSMAFASALALYGIVVRGKTGWERRRQRAYAVLGTGLMLDNNLWEHIGLSETTALAMNICGSVVLIVGVVLMVKSKDESTLPGGSSTT